MEKSENQWRLDFLPHPDYMNVTERVAQALPKHLTSSLVDSNGSNGKESHHPLRTFRGTRDGVKVFLLDADFDQKRWDQNLYPLSMVNGVLKTLSNSEMKSLLTQYQLNPSGKDCVLAQRLKRFLASVYQTQHKFIRPTLHSPSANDRVVTRKDFDFYLFLNVQCNVPDTGNIKKYAGNIDELLDFEPRRKIWEITQQLRRTDFLNDCGHENQEIVRIDALMVKANDFGFVSSFGSYVRPRENKRLSIIAKVITKIMQHQVDSAPSYEIVYRNLFSWLRENGALKSMTNVLIITDGSHDIEDYMRNSFYRSHLSFPYWMRSYVDLKKLFAKFYKIRTKSVVRMNLYKSLYLLELPYFRCECCPTGVISVVNLARLARAMSNDNCCLASVKFVDDKNSEKQAVELKDSMIDKIRKTIDPVLLNEFIDLPVPDNYEEAPKCLIEDVELPDVRYSINRNEL